MTRFLAPALVLIALLLPHRSHAEPMIHLSIVGDGNDFEFDLPTSTTEPDTLLSNQFSAPSGPLFIFPGPCAVCDTIEVGSAGKTVFIGLPDLYQLTYPTMDTATFTFLPGSYTSLSVSPRDFSTYLIDVAPTSVASTPEPPTFWLLASALFGVATLFRRRLLL